MAGHSHDLMLRRAGLREACRRGLPEPVGRTVWKPRLIAPVTHLVAKACSGERTIKLGYEKCEIADRACVDNALQIG